MKVAIDLDGTAFKHVKLLSELVHALKKDGHQVGIITAHGEENRHSDIKKWRKLGYPDPDFYIPMPPYYTYIGEFKREHCILNNIDILIDDLGGNNPDIEQSFTWGGVPCLLLRVSPGENRASVADVTNKKDRLFRPRLNLENQYPFESCGCDLCEFIHERLRNGIMDVGSGWCDPRRMYLESEEEFLKRVPDGFLKWSPEHKDIKRKVVSFGGPTIYEVKGSIK